MNLTHKQIKTTLQSLRPQGGYVIHGNEIIWDQDQQPVSEEEILNAAQVVTPDYREQRQAEYPSVEDQLDMMYHNGYDAWKEVITTIKNKYPKPNI